LDDFISGKFSSEIDQIAAGQVIPVIHPGKIKGVDTLQALVNLAHEISTFSPVIVLKDKLSWHTSQTQAKHAFVEMLTSAFEEGELSLNVVAVLKKHTARNVIAEIPAKRRAKKTIVFTAHYDHLGRMGQNTYFPGANDNASGTTMLLSLARELVQTPSDTRYIFMAFAGEEVAILGSNYFVKHPTFKLSSIDFLINLDILGGAQNNITVVNGTEFVDQFQRLVDLNKEHQFVPDVKSRKPTSNSDHVWFYQRGVPCFYIYTSGSNKHYHVPEDHAHDVDLDSFANIRHLLLAFVRSF
jgi:putative aminopeptidase FrvX